MAESRSFKDGRCSDVACRSCSWVLSEVVIELLFHPVFRSALQCQVSLESAPTAARFFRFSLHVQQPADGFLALEGFTKGFACVNGFNLGRYWQARHGIKWFVELRFTSQV